jgi:ATP-dependent RNA helicase RhlE
MPFVKLGLSSQVLEGVKAMGYIEPTPIQLRAIPLIMSGKDVIGSAQTGTGKTAAFALPILSRLAQHQPQPRVLILEPTRELAAQVETAVRDFARFTNLRIAVVFGGVGYGAQRDALKNGVDVLVATPGRLLDLMHQGTCRLDRVQHPPLAQGHGQARHLPGIGLPEDRPAARIAEAGELRLGDCLLPH